MESLIEEVLTEFLQWLPPEERENFKRVLDIFGEAADKGDV